MDILHYFGSPESKSIEKSGVVILSLSMKNLLVEIRRMAPEYCINSSHQPKLPFFFSLSCLLPQIVNFLLCFQLYPLVCLCCLAYTCLESSLATVGERGVYCVQSAPIFSAKRLFSYLEPVTYTPREKLYHCAKACPFSLHLPTGRKCLNLLYQLVNTMLLILQTSRRYCWSIVYFL